MALATRENPFINLLANVVLPVFILNKFSPRFPIPALLVALALPLAYGIWSFARSKKINFISLLGLLNTMFTGGFALLKLEGMWFAAKEAGFPFLIGCFVLFSAFGASPFLQMLMFDTGILNSEEIDVRVRDKGTSNDFKRLLKKTTFLFSLTFFFSAIMNFWLAWRIFTKIPVELADDQRADMLNQQIASMTWQGYVVIFLPSILLFFGLMFFFFRKLSKLTDLPFDKLVKG